MSRADSEVVRVRVKKVAELLQTHRAWAWIFPSGDPHASEYPAPPWQSRAWISGFHGSAGTAVVLADGRGALWTDSRYFLEASEILADSPFVLMKEGQSGTPGIQEWIFQTAKTAGYGKSGPLADGPIPATSPVILAEATGITPGFLAQHGLSSVTLAEGELNSIWTDRPALIAQPIREFSEKVAGKSREKKIEELVSVLASEGADGMLVSALDEIAWVLNLRGEDVEYNPVFYAYLFIGRSPVGSSSAGSSTSQAPAAAKPKSLAYGFEAPQTEDPGAELWATVGDYSSLLFTQDERLTPEVRRALGRAEVGILPYEDCQPWLAGPGSKKKIWYNPSQISAGFAQTLTENAKGSIAKELPITLAKAKKTPAEVSSLRSCMVEDGESLVRAFAWIESSIAKGSVLSEAEIAEKIGSFRSQIAGYRGESFHAIVGFARNGAIIHYRPEEPGCARVGKPGDRGLLLIDCGGQFDSGTTDVTRTLVIGVPTAEEKERYTLVLKGHVALSRARFPVGTVGTQLDTFARQALWERGLNYGHGTGHGVGFAMNVHEGPARISPVPNPAPLAAGMVMSNEPGFYKNGSYGIRIENLVAVRPVSTPGFDGFLEFETLTIAPYEPELIDRSLLTPAEIEWVNEYHRWVYDALAPGLNGEALGYLEKKTVPLE